MAATAKRPEIQLSRGLRGIPQIEDYECVISGIPAYSVAVGSPARVMKTIQSVEEEEEDANNPYRNMTCEDELGI